MNYFQFGAYHYGPCEYNLEEYLYSNSKYTKDENDMIILNKEYNSLETIENILINDSVDTLIKLNPNIFLLTKWILIDITQDYNSWKLNFKPGENNKIPNQHIEGDKRKFKL